MATITPSKQLIMAVAHSSTKGADAAPSGNPQGKGLVPILQHWWQYQPHQVQQKPAASLLSDYAISLLVLSAQFNFKPVPGQQYFLYLKRQSWHLSLIEPQRWDQRGGTFLGRCELHRDMTWKLEPKPDFADEPELVEALQRFRKSLIEQFSEAETLQQQLPYYVAELPFYRRLAANGLATSIALSARNSGLLQQPVSRWLASAARDFRLLPAAPSGTEN